MTQIDDAHVPVGDDYVSDRAFADFPIAEDTLRGIVDELGFEVATPVQAATIDAALDGRDMIVRAKTGTGKTAAFLVPMIERIEDGARKPTAIVLEPTRELAQQTAEQAGKIAAFRDMRVVTIVGGVAMGPQEDALKAGAELIVGTPGRVLDHIRRGNLDPSTITITCLDEADEMLSMGFFEDVSAILSRTADDRQVLLFSATISGDTQRLVARFLKDPEEVMLSTDADGVELLEHVLYETSPAMHKARALLYVLDLEDPDSAIIFCNTREDVATISTYLDRQGLDAQMISGELSQSRRTAVMKKVKAGAVRFLVATDVAARGIDISDLSHVINYALPQDPAVYMHRTGRTGRIGKKGMAISLVGGADLATRNVLENQKGIAFVQRELPSSEDAVRHRIERQAKQIKEALGSLVFESYLPTVRALKERDDGDMLLAAALRAFFQWDRERRAEAADPVELVDEEERGNRRGRKGRDDRRGKGKGRSDRDDRRDDARDDDGQRKRKRRRKKGGRDDDDRRDDRRDDKPRTDRKPKREAAPALDDLDALLEVEEDAPKAKKPSKKPKKAKKADKPKAPKDDLDALLEVEDDDTSDEASIDDLDALLEVED